MGVSTALSFTVGVAVDIARASGVPAVRQSLDTSERRNSRELRQVNLSEDCCNVIGSFFVDGVEASAIDDGEVKNTHKSVMLRLVMIVSVLSTINKRPRLG